MRFIVIGINDAAQQEALGFRNAELADVIAAHLTAEPDSVAEADALMVAARGVVKRLS